MTEKYSAHYLQPMIYTVVYTQAICEDIKYKVCLWSPNGVLGFIYVIPDIEFLFNVARFF